MIRSFLALTLLAAVVAAPAVAAESSLDRIRTTRTIKLGFLPDAPPFSMAVDGKSPQGYSVELCEHIANGIAGRLGVDKLTVNWVPLTLANRFDAVAKGDVDLECSTSTWTFGRQEKVEFSLTTFVDGGSILVRNDTDFFRAADLKGKRIAVAKSTTTEPSLREALRNAGISAEVVPVSTVAQGLTLLGAGDVDGFASDRVKLIGLALEAQGANTFRIIEEDFSVEPYALALRPDDPALRLAVNRTLAELFRTGEIMKVYDHWLGPLGKPGVLLNALYYLNRIPE
ncbi:MAG: amino acid ABC transporter substrate-binding protein [Burkholderiales bacterium]|nr:amino acid ABC transporter substrate-binding protein [Burkholderiales bacterium]